MRKILESSRVNPRRLVPYDPSSYSKNFDRGFAWDDHDHDDYISRSFSFRFADPSNENILVKPREGNGLKRKDQ